MCNNPAFWFCYTDPDMRRVDRPRLNSWKEIAAYLGCSEKTARRWEVSRQMPIHRVPGGAKGSVYAFPGEIDDWLANRPIQEPGSAEPQRPQYSSRGQAFASRGRMIVAALLSSLLVGGGALLAMRTRRTVRLSGAPVRLVRSLAAKLPPLLTARSLVFFQEQTNDYARFVMTQASLRGDSSGPMNLPLENPDPGVVAPDGSAMLLRSVRGSKDGDEPLFLQPLPAGEPIRLGEIRAYDSAWTPDRNHIVFSRKRTVYLASRDGKILRKLFDLPGRAYHFRWSPKTGSLRFSVSDSKLSSYRIWQTDSLAGPPSPVWLGIDESAQQCCGEWSPDGRVFYFQALVDGFYQVFAHEESSSWLHLGRGTSTQLTSGPLNYRSPLPTQDGKALILFTQSQKSELVYYETAKGRWLPLLDGVSAATGAFSPDGRWLAYTRPSDHTLWRCRAPACTDPIRLTAPPARIAMPRWSPDGSQIACMMRTLGTPWRAVVLPASGGPVRRLIPGAGEEADPDWSPTGDQVIFGRPPNPDSGSDAELRILELKTGVVRPVPGSRGYLTPRWSPDGKFLAAVRSGALEPALYELATGRWSPLPGKRVGYLNWSADSSTLFLLSGAGSREPSFLAVKISDRAAHVVASLSIVRKPPFSFGDWVGLGPGDVPLALRDLSSEEVLCWPLAPYSTMTTLFSRPTTFSACPAPGSAH